MTASERVGGAHRVRVRTSGRITLGIVAIALLLGQWPIVTTLSGLNWFGAANFDVWDAISRGVVVFSALLLAHAISGTGIWPRRWRDVSLFNLGTGLAIIVGVAVFSWLLSNELSAIQLPVFGLAASGRIVDPIVAIGAALMASAVPVSRWRPRTTWISFAAVLALVLALVLTVDHVLPLVFVDPAQVEFSYDLARGLTLIAASLLADGALGVRWEPEWLALVVVFALAGGLVMSSTWGFDTPAVAVMDTLSGVFEVAFAALVVGFWRGTVRAPEVLSDGSSRS